MILVTLIGTNIDKIYSKDKKLYVQSSLSENIAHGLDETEYLIKNRSNLTFEKYYDHYYDHRQNYGLQIIKERLYGFVICVDNLMLFYALQMLFKKKNALFTTQNAYENQLFLNHMVKGKMIFSNFLETYFKPEPVIEQENIEVKKKKVVIVEKEKIDYDNEKFGEQLSFI